jgi:hypothetical protein
MANLMDIGNKMANLIDVQAQIENLKK